MRTTGGILAGRRKRRSRFPDHVWSPPRTALPTLGQCIARGALAWRQYIPQPVPVAPGGYRYKSTLSIDRPAGRPSPAASAALRSLVWTQRVSQRFTAVAEVNTGALTSLPPAGGSTPGGGIVNLIAVPPHQHNTVDLGAGVTQDNRADMRDSESISWAAGPMAPLQVARHGAISEQAQPIDE